MTRDSEAAWPLTDINQGYYPGQAPTPGPLMPVATPPAQYMAVQPIPNRKQSLSPAMRLAFLGTILGLTIPLTAIATSMLGIIGLIVTWAGVVAVATLALGPVWRSPGN